MSERHPTIIIDKIIEDDSWLKTEPATFDIIDQVTKETIYSTDFAKYVREIEYSVVLADDDYIKQLNKQYRNKDKATNVLSFPNEVLNPQDFSTVKTQEGYIMLGDIVLAFETVLKEAKEQNKSFKDHFCHLLTHGTLHLLGFDHQTDIEALAMEQLEIFILKKFAIKSPYLYEKTIN